MSINNFNEFPKDIIGSIFALSTLQSGACTIRGVCKQWKGIFDEVVLKCFVAQLQTNTHAIPKALGLRSMVQTFTATVNPPEQMTCSCDINAFKTFNREIKRAIGPKAAGIIVSAEQIRCLSEKDTNLHILWNKIKSAIPGAPDLKTAEEISEWMEKHPDAFVNITELNLHNQNLTSLPSEIRFLTHLQKLDLYCNQLQSLPDAIRNLTQLRGLSLYCNQLQSLPEAIGNLTQLQELYLSYNQLQSLPDAIGNLTQLQELYLSENQLQSLPEAIGNLTQLQLLDLSNNQLQSLPDAIGNLTQLQLLELSNNQLQSLPEAIRNCTQLQRLGLSENQLQSLPEAIGNLTQLQLLDLSNNQLQSLPEAIGNLTQLQELYLSYNQLQSLPDAIRNLIQLQLLDLSYNQLQSLPEAIGNCTQLQLLYLSNNQLQSLPEAIGNCTQLQEFDLSKNQLQSLPDAIGNLTQLQELDLSENQLQSLPDAIGNLTQLQTLTLGKNQLLFIDNKVIERFSNDQTIQKFVAECKYLPKSKLSILYHAIITRKTIHEINEYIKQAFFALEERDKTFVYQLIFPTIDLMTKDAQWKAEHVFDQPEVFFRAARGAGEIRFHDLDEDAQNKVYGSVYDLAGKPDTTDYQWDEHHAFDILPRLFDAMMCQGFTS